MEKIACLSCGWEGQEEQLIEMFIPNENNSEDHCLYPVKCCPFCEDENSLIYSVTGVLPENLIHTI